MNLSALDNKVAELEKVANTINIGLIAMYSGSIQNEEIMSFMELLSEKIKLIKNDLDKIIDLSLSKE
ncbi:MAG: hypothetical protein RBS91_08430 [Sulfurimonadaceae bacterium]|jgi:hypothetical protein|nr:hypothetical protein [Sulfurimonadaceae bacterium]